MQFACMMQHAVHGAITVFILIHTHHLIHAHHLIDAHPPSWNREIMIASCISPIIAHDDASFIRFSRYIQCFLMVMDSKH